MSGTDRVQAWRPQVDGVAEVLHARWHQHAYPSHTHDTWTLLVVDAGVIGYQLDRHDHGAVPSGVTVLPPHVVHDGHAVTPAGFRKRVVYLEEDVVGSRYIGRAADVPMLADDALRSGVSGLDRALVNDRGLEAEARLAMVVERLRWDLAGRPATVPDDDARDPAASARDLIDADPATVTSIAALAEAVGVSTPHLVRSFSRRFGIAPHRYVLGRRLDLARRRLLAGEPAGEVAASAGFYDQAHLTRHFKRFLSTTPGSYQRSGLSAAG